MKYSRKSKTDFDKDKIAGIAAVTGYSPVIIELLMMRGFETREEIEGFINTDSIIYSSPESLPGLTDAVTIINNNIRDNKKIVVYGDYDVDGICGTSIFLRTFKRLGFTNFSYYIPDRLSEGYGLNINAIGKIKEQGAELLITVDCGISNVNEVNFARNNKIDVIVTDHHSCPDMLPECTIVNPKLSGDPLLHKLCGAAVAMKVCQALCGYSDDYVMLAAMAAIADMSPLSGENRKLVKDGIELINHKADKGIARLTERLSGDRRISSTDLAFGVLPAINAAGRIHKPDICVDLLSGMAKDPNCIIEELSQLNNKRKSIEEKIINSALDRILKEKIYLGKSIIISDESWHVGVLGIAASRIKNLYYRPVILLSKEGNIYKGSCRSIEGIDIFRVLNSMPELFISYGGHSSAAGITIAEEHYKEFISRFEKCVERYDDDLFSPYKDYDIELDTSSIDFKLVNDLRLLEPFGMGNPEPRFLLKSCSVQSFSKMGVDRHYRAIFNNSGKGLNCVRFNDVSIENTIGLGLKYDLLISASINEFNGNKSVQGLIEHVKCSAGVDELKPILASDDLYKVSVSQLLYSGSTSEMECGDYSFEGLKKYLRSNPFGCLVLVTSPYAADCLLTSHTDIFDLAALSGFLKPFKSEENQIVFAPDIEMIDFSLYQYTCLITSAGYKDYIYSLPQINNRIIIDENNNKAPLLNLEITVDELRGIYKDMMKSRAVFDDLNYLVPKKADLWKYRIAKRIFIELDILANGEDNKYYIKGNKKVVLENSSTYCNLMRYQELINEKNG